MGISPPAPGASKGTDQDICSLTHLLKAGLDMTINVGDIVRVQQGPHAGEIHTVERVRGSLAWFPFSGLPGSSRGTSPYPIKYLTKLDSPTFNVGDRVTDTVGSMKGESATVVGMHRHWVKVRMDSRHDDVRYYLPLDLVLLPSLKSDLPAVDADTETVTRVVAVFQSPKAPELDMSFTNASEADVWIDHLKIAPGVAAVTVTRDTTETFTRNNA